MTLLSRCPIFGPVSRNSTCTICHLDLAQILRDSLAMEGGWTRMRTIVLLAGLFWCLMPARAAQANERIEASYDFVLGGFLVSTADTVAEIGSQDYQLDINFRMRGLARIFSSGHSDITATGRLADGGIVAQRYVSSGRWDGDDFAKTMIFGPDGRLQEQKLDWPKKWQEEYRYEPVPPELQMGPDPASLVIAILRDPPPASDAEASKSYRVFDGESVFDWRVVCAPGTVELEKTRRSDHAGPARECRVYAELVAGALIETEKQRKEREKAEAKAERKREKAEAKGKEPEDTSPKIWLQPLQGSDYLLPVRAEMRTGMGTVHMYLKSLTVADEAADASLSR
ncbi:MAG: DUF3108 domain-containing protein [Alphaproteobacteria bacterium]|nr:MAG: DUF3108 domain-containing protein [Alphaproteobacteria bacterium]